MDDLAKAEAELQQHLMTLQENVSDIVALMTQDEFNYFITLPEVKAAILAVDKRLTDEGRARQ